MIIINNNQIISILIVLIQSICNVNSHLIIKTLNAYVDTTNSPIFDSWELNTHVTLKDGNEFTGSLNNSDLIINDNKTNSFKLSLESINSLGMIELSVDDYDMVLSLEFLGNFENVYDNIINEILYASNCYSTVDKQCCPYDPYEKSVLNSHSFAKNTTSTFKLYKIKTNPTLNLNYKFVKPVPSTSSSPSSSAPSIVTKDITDLQFFIDLFNSSYIAFEITYSIDSTSSNSNQGKPFFIPKIYVGDDSNKIGISKSKFNSLLSTICDIPNKSITAVGDSNNMYDQFYSFRENTIENIISGCSIKSLGTLDGSSIDNFTLQCNIKDAIKYMNPTSLLSMIFKFDSYPLVNVTSIPILSGGIVPLSTIFETYSVNLYVDILNRGSDGIQFKIVSLDCRNYNENYGYDLELSIEKEKVITVNNDGYSTRVEFQVSSKSTVPISTLGYCKFSVYRNLKEYCSDITINFSTTKDQYIPNPNNIKGRSISSGGGNNNNLQKSNLVNAESCTLPKVSVTISGIEYCVECTIDQTLDTYFARCVNVNCGTKYANSIPKKLYFNSDTGLCQESPKCEEGYNSVSNKCIKQGTGSSSESTTDSSIGPPTFNYSSSSDGYIIIESGSGTSSSLVVIIFIVATIILIIIVFIIIKKCCNSRRRAKEKKRKQKEREREKRRKQQQQDDDDEYERNRRRRRRRNNNNNSDNQQGGRRRRRGRPQNKFD